MKRKLQLVMAFLFAMVGTQSVSAQSWVGQTVQDGTFYLYNVGSSQFFCAANSWGTHASLNDVGMDVTLTTMDGGYSIDTQISNGGTSHFLNGVWCDGAAQAWTFTSNGDGSYTIDNGSGALGSDGSTVLIQGAMGDNAKWKLVSRQDRMDALSAATATNGVDATFYLSCPDFGRNDTRISAWQGGPSRGGEDANNCGEKWNAGQFDVYQTVTVKSGIYKITCQGFYREGGQPANPALTAQNAILYIGDTEVPLASIFDGAGQNGTTGESTASGYVPSNMTSASSYFNAGLYAGNEAQGAVGTTLRVGIKKSVTSSNDWAIFDHFRLTYYGVDPDALKNGIVASQALAATLVSGKMNEEVKKAMTTAAAAYVPTNTYTTAELENISTDLDAAIAAAQASIKGYDNFKKVLDNAILLDSASNVITGFGTYNTAVANAEKGYNDGTMSNVSLAINKLRAAEADYIKTAIDKTKKGKNMSFEEGSTQLVSVTGAYEPTSWTISTAAPSGLTGDSKETANTFAGTMDGKKFYDMWAGTTAGDLDFEMQQTISGLPEGKYIVTANMMVSATGSGASRMGTQRIFANGVESEYFAFDEYYTAPDGAEGLDWCPFVTLNVVATVGADGNLTIGARSNGNGNTTSGAGWFKLDNVRIYSTSATDNIVLDEMVNDYKSEEGSNGENVQITLKRDLKAGWNTICIPFDVNASDVESVFGTGARVARYDSFDNTTKDMNFKTGMGILANVPCLIYVPTDRDQFTATAPLVPSPEETTTCARSDFDGTMTLIGSYEVPTPVNTDSYMFNPTTSTFDRVVAGTSMNAFQAFAAYTNEDGSLPEYFNVVFDPQPVVPTGIEGVGAENAIIGDVYTVSGQLVRKNATSLNGLAKGIYVVNGKKVIVK